MKCVEKKDWRLQLSRDAICKAFLRLKQTKGYHEISVAELCREASVSRGVFYRQYNNISDVLDDVLNQALSEVKGLEEQLKGETPVGCTYPLCRFIRESKQYQCLFYDDAITPQLLDKIYAAKGEALQRLWASKAMLDAESVRSLIYFQLSGCLTALKRSRSLSDEQWGQTQLEIDRLLRSRLISETIK